MTSSLSPTVRVPARIWNGLLPSTGKRGSVSSVGLADSNGGNSATLGHWMEGSTNCGSFSVRADRVYFGEHRGTMILLLTGGDKSTQKKDIKTAMEFWKIYMEDNS